MIFTIDQLTQRVRTAIGRHCSGKSLLSHVCGDTLELNHVICSKIAPSAQYVYRHLPIEMIADSAKDLSEEGIYWHDEVDGLYGGHILLPRDYGRLHVFEMSDWRHPTFEAYGEDHPLYDVQHSEYAGVFGTPYRPVCLVSEGSEGRLLEFYSCRTPTAQVTQAQYIPLPEIDVDGGINLSSRAVDQVVVTTAMFTLTTIGEFEKAQQLTKLITYL